MEFLKEWTLTICITLVISVIFSVLTPKGNMGKFFKIILATFIFLSFIYPFKSDEIDFSFPEFSAEELAQEQKDTYEKTVTAQTLQALESQGYKSCSVKSRISLKDNEILIKSLTITAPDSYNKDEIKKYIFDTLGINAEVYYLGE